MKRQPLRKVTGSLLAFLTAGCLFLCSSCGIEQFYHIEPPMIVSEADGDASDSLHHVCSFIAMDDEIAKETSIESHGTAVYYRIYDNKQRMEDQVKRITESNTPDTENGFNKMTTTYLFQQMQPTIPYTPQKKTVTIRLSTEEGYEAEIFCTPTPGDVSFSDRTPRRAGSGGFTFSTDPVPQLNDVDYDHDTAVSAPVSIWYVPLFAAATGRTPDSPAIYSQLTYLGYFTIQQGN